VSESPPDAKDSVFELFESTEDAVLRDKKCKSKLGKGIISPEILPHFIPST